MGRRDRGVVATMEKSRYYDADRPFPIPVRPAYCEICRAPGSEIAKIITLNERMLCDKCIDTAAALLQAEREKDRPVVIPEVTVKKARVTRKK